MGVPVQRGHGKGLAAHLRPRPDVRDRDRKSKDRDRKGDDEPPAGPRHLAVEAVWAAGGAVWKAAWA